MGWIRAIESVREALCRMGSRLEARSGLFEHRAQLVGDRLLSDGRRSEASIQQTLCHRRVLHQGKDQTVEETRLVCM
jgi:hypothetical protein